MKKGLVVVFMLISALAFGQDTPYVKPVTPTKMASNYQFQKQVFVDSLLKAGKMLVKDTAGFQGVTTVPLVADADSSNKVANTAWVKRNGGSGSTSATCGAYTGAVTWSGTGLTYNATSGTYCINDVSYTFAGDSVTLATADPTNDRFDVIILTTTGIDVITGTPSATPQIPTIDPATQQYLTAVLVAAGSTTPSGVVQRIVWDENTGSPEWVLSSTGITANGDNATNVYSGAKSTDVGAFTAGDVVQYAGVSYPVTPYNTLKFFIRLKSIIATSASINLQFIYGGAVVSTQLRLGTLQGFDRTVINAYQLVSVKLTDIPIATDSISGLRFVMQGSNANGFYLDRISIDGGTSTGTTGTGLTDVFYSTDSLYKTVNGVNMFVGLRDRAGLLNVSDTATMLAGYQRDLIAGTNVTITGNTISATGGGGGSFDSYASIAALKAFDASAVTNGTYIELAGYYAANDGGGGLFVWNSSSTVTDNGGTVIKSTPVTTGRWLRVYNGNINTNWFGAMPGRVVTDRLQAALNMTGGIETPYHPLKLIIDDRLIIKSNTNWIINPQDTIWLADSMNTVLLRNENLDTSGITDQNIRVSGGIWNTNWANNPGTTLYAAGYSQLQSDKVTPIRGAAGVLTFVGVRDLVVKGMTIINPRTFSVQVQGFENIEVGDIDFVRTEATVSDGVHLNGPGNTFYVHDLTGRTGDDLLALNSWDWYVSSPAANGLGGDIKKGTVERLLPDTSAWGTIKMNTGTNAGVYDVAINDIKGVSSNSILCFVSGSLEPDQHHPAHTTGMGKIGNITVDGISGRTLASVAGFVSIVYGPIITLACDADNLSINNAVIDSNYQPYLNQPYLKQEPTTTAKNITINNFIQKDSLAWGGLFDFRGTVNTLTISNSKFYGSGGFTGNRALQTVYLAGTSNVPNITLSNNKYIGVAGAVKQDASAGGTTLQINNSYFIDFETAVTTGSGMSLMLSNNSFSNIGTSIVSTSVYVGALSSNNYTDLSGVTLVKTGGAARWQGLDLPIDGTLLTSILTNDLVLNNNAAAGATGNAFYDGSTLVAFGGGSSSGSDFSSMIRTTGETSTPVSGQGLEFSFYTPSSTSVINSYSRTAAAFRALEINGSILNLNNNSNGAVNFGNGNILFGTGNFGFNGAVSSTAQFSVAGHQTTKNNAEFGTFGIQSYSTNNGWLSDNAYFDGTNFRYRANGTAELLYFAGGGLIVQTAVSGTAGNIITFTTRQRWYGDGKVEATVYTDYADNAAAIAGGLTNGMFYRTGDVVKQVHP